ncbi:family 1 glycosylhydrolase [Candidatus Marsarchaeota archaeon]|nr:family 1 glycosylhydrolase [Candidatus Marsarchaeota archaeon]
MFPDDFIFGSNLSDYQHFGGSECDMPLIYSVKHKEYFKEDLQYIDVIGLTGFRFNIEWARIEPHENFIDKAAVKFYHAYFDELKKYNVKTIVTLHHFTNPEWIHKYGGMESSHVRDKFLAYVDFVSNEFGRNIDYFAVFNEPVFYLYNAYIAAKFPPFHRCDAVGMLRALKNVSGMHSDSYSIIKSNSAGSQVGSVNAVSSNIDANIVLRPIQSAAMLANRIFIDSSAKRSDFIGINYYVSLKNMFSGNYKINPDGLSDAAVRIYSRHGKPVIITENGMPTTDANLKSAYLIKHLRSVENAIENKHIVIKGYFYWSFLHGYEWFNDYRPNFGLINVHLGTMERQATKAAFAFSRVIKEKTARSIALPSNTESSLSEFKRWPFSKNINPLNPKMHKETDAKLKTKFK